MIRTGHATKFRFFRSFIYGFLTKDAGCVVPFEKREHFFEQEAGWFLYLSPGGMMIVNGSPDGGRSNPLV